jgi:hypothetical protein
MEFIERPIARRTVLGTAFAAAGAVTTLRMATPAQAASELGGPIERSEVVRRAKFWVDEGVPYSQNQDAAYTDGDGHKYRPDCSGYVSMGWHLVKKSNGWDRNTSDFQDWSGKSWLGDYGNLKQGDALLSSGHIVIFDKWTDGTRTSMRIYQEPNWGRRAEYVRRTAAYFRGDGFRALRYDKIVDDGGAETPDPHGSLWIRSRSASGAWAGSATKLDANTAVIDVAAAALPDGTLHVFTIVPKSGVWHRVRSASGTWGGSAKIDENGAITALAASGMPDGTLHLQTVVPGAGVWNRTRNAAGAWQSSATKIDDNAHITRVSSAALPNGVLHVQTLVAEAGVWNRARSAAGAWESSATQIDNNNYIIDIACGASPNGTLLFAAVVPESGIWTRQRAANGAWASSATKTDQNGNVDAVSVAGLPDGTVHLNAILTGSGVWNRTRSASGTWAGSATKIDDNDKIFAGYAVAHRSGELNIGSLVNAS